MRSGSPFPKNLPLDRINWSFGASTMTGGESSRPSSTSGRCSDGNTTPALAFQPRSGVANAPGLEREMPATDDIRPENNENLGPKLDQAIADGIVPEEKSGAADPENVVSQAKEMLSEAAVRTSEAAHFAYKEGAAYIRQATKRYPEAGRHYRQGIDAVRQYASENPLVTLLIGMGIGYAVATIIESGGPRRGRVLGEGFRAPRSSDSPKPHGDKYASAIRPKPRQT